MITLPYFCRVCGKRIKGIGSEAKHISEWAMAFTKGKTHWRYKKHYDFLVRNHSSFDYEEVKKLIEEMDSKTLTDKNQARTPKK
ncbi:MAG: hypothetical protein WED07_14365 [Candidatus Freyarchaeum deiterrae]